MKNPYVDLVKAVWHNGKPWRGAIVLYYTAFIVAQACLSLNPYAFGRAIDVLQHFTPARLHEVIYWILLTVGVLVLFWVFHGPARVLERRVALKIQQAFRVRVYEQLTQLPLKWHQDNHSGNVITRINRASVALFQFAGDQFIYIETIILFITSVGFLLWISVPVGILSLLTCLITIAMVLLFDRILIPLYKTENEIDNHVGAVVFDYISNMTTVLTLRLGDLTRTNLYQRMMKVWPTYRKDTVVNEVKWCATGIFLSLMQALILIGYIVHALKTTNSILIGTAVMIFRYQWGLSEVFFTFSANYSAIVRMDTDVKGIQPILDDLERLAHAPKDAALAQQWHTLSICDVEFHHLNSVRQQSMFDNLNLTIKRGEKIALIGSSGGGKSTLLNVLRGLYKVDKGYLIIDGVKSDSLEPLQAITTLIPQDPEIFENTIAFNISMDVPVDSMDIDQVVKLAGFDDILAKLPLGLETEIREKGSNFSVGQKQRLALARGLFAARFSSLILMDEPTSSVDLPTEKRILTGVMNAFPDAAVIVSLHRLHLLPKFDRVIMLSNGSVLASGSTAELLHQPGPVRDLWLAYQDVS